MKVVINRCFGGFGLSDTAEALYAKRKGIEVENVHYYDIPRDDADLVFVVESLGKDVNTPYSSLKVIDIPDDVNWYISEYDGLEHIAERHRTWE